MGKARVWKFQKVTHHNSEVCSQEQTHTCTEDNLLPFSCTTISSPCPQNAGLTKTKADAPGKKKQPNRRPSNQITERQAENELLYVPQRGAPPNGENLNHKISFNLIQVECLLCIILLFINHKRNLVCTSHFKSSWLFSAPRFCSSSG